MADLLPTINMKGSLLLDGATGTGLFELGLLSGDAPELWNDIQPERVFKLNAGFVEAGSDVILANSFGANAMRLKLHKAQHRVSELNEKAVQIAKQAADQAEREVFVAGSMGPLGELIEPVGTLGMDEAVQAFTDQALALERGGCNLLMIETISSVEELVAAATGAMSTGLDYICCGSFDSNGRTMMGVTPKQFAKKCTELSRRPIAVGSNCGIGPAQTVAALLEMVESMPDEFHYVAKANCGVPVWEGDKIKYSATPEQMYTYARISRDVGATMIGGCCGTQAQHVERMRAGLNGYEPSSRPTLEQVSNVLGAVFDTAKQNKPRKRGTRRRK